MIVLYVMSSGTPQANLKQIFRVFDINNDKEISAKVRKYSKYFILRSLILNWTFSFQEMKRIVKDLYHLLNKNNPDKASKEDIAEEAFKEMDINTDGKVSEEEFVNAIMNQRKFSKMLALNIIDVFISE